MRVTTILRLAGLRPPLTQFCKDPEWILARGSAIHKAVALMDVGRLDWNSLDERIVPYVKAARKFRQECGGKLVKQEYEVANPDKSIVGHLDAVYQNMMLRRHNRKLCLVDWKTNDVDAATAIQTAAYVNLWYCQCPEDTISYRAGVALHDDGTYGVTWYTQHASDSEGWAGAVAIAKWRLRNGEREDETIERKVELI